MARELNIIPNLQWLVKQVNNIALNKRQIMNTSVNVPATNTNLTPGLWYYSGTSLNGAFVFPDPSLYKGQTILIYFGGPIGGPPAFSNAYTPIDSAFQVPISTFQIKLLYKYYSTGTLWVGGIHY